MGPGSGVTIRPELGQGYLEIDLMSLRAGYVGFRLMPLAVMEREAGVYPKITLEKLVPKITLDMMRRHADGTYPRSTWSYGSDNFSTEEFGLEEPVDDRQGRILRYHGLDPDQIAADRSTASAMRALETGIAARVQDATTFSAVTNPVTNEWDDYTNATPITDIKSAMERFEDRNAGIKPNKLVMNLGQARNVLLCDQVRDHLGRRPTEGLGQEQLQGNALMLARLEAILAMVLGVSEVVIADGFGNSKLPGVAGTYSRIYSDEYVSLLHTAQGGQDLRQVGFGRVMAWTGDGGGTGQTISVEDYYQPDRRSRVIRARFDLEIKTVHSSLIEILSNITT